MYKTITGKETTQEDKTAFHSKHQSARHQGLVNNRPEAIHQLSVQQMADKHLSQHQKASGQFAGNQPVQLKVDIKEYDVTDQDKGQGSKSEMFQTVAAKLKPIIEKSPLSQGNLNTVEILGVFNEKLNWFGSTTVFIGNKQQNQEDYKNYDELPYLGKSQLKKVDAQSPFKVQLALNLKLHESIENLYTTLLHEWHVHGVTWESALATIRSGDQKAKERVAVDNNEYLMNVRANEEHKAYATWSDETLKSKTEELGLDEEQERKVLELFKQDRDNYKPSVPITKEVVDSVSTSRSKRSKSKQLEKEIRKVIKVDPKKDDPKIKKVKKKRGRPPKKKTEVPDQMNIIDSDTE